MSHFGCKLLIALLIQQSLVFDVAVIKPTALDGHSGAIRPMPNGEGYMATGVPLKYMIRVMYAVIQS